MPPLILSAAQNTTIGMKTRWNGTTDVGVNTPGYISVPYGLNINQLTGNFVNYNGVNYPFDYTSDGSFSINDLTGLGRLYNGFNDTVTVPAYSLAIKSFYGTKPVGIGFHVGTIGDINSLITASLDPTRPIYSSNVNSMIVGYSTGGPKLFISERDIKSEKQNVFRFVGGSTFFGANDVIFGDDGLPTGLSSPQSGVVRGGDAGYNIDTAGASLYLRGGKGTGSGAGGDIVFNTSPVNSSGTITFTGTIDAGLSTISGIPSTSALSVGMFIRQTTGTVGASIGKLSYALSTSYGLALITAINSSSQITISPAATVAGANTFYASIENDPVERMRITSSGNVGIGTISPSNPLHVSGGQEWPAKFQFASDTIGLRSSLLIQRSRGTVASPTAVIANTNLGGLSIGGYDGTSYSSGYNGGSELMAFASENWTSTARGSYLTLSTTSDGSAAITERVRITSSGNVGIGTSSPAYLLTVAGDILRESTIDGAARLNIRNLSTGINAHTILNIGNDVSANSFVIFTNSSGRTGDGGTGTTTLRTDYGQLRISSASNGIYMASNVGIGTSSPGFPLHISSSTSQNLANFNYSTAGGYSEIQVSSNDRSIILGQRSSTAPAGDLAYLYTPNATPFAIYNSATERFRITSSGNVGIGTSSPSQALDVVGNIQLKATAGNTSYLIIDSPVYTGGGSSILFRTNGVNKWTILSYQQDNRMYIQDADGNDGVYMAQNTTAWVSNSDLRLKNVQGTITNALDKVQQLTGVKFTWKRESDNPNAKVRVGLIAQDVQAVLPEAVDDESPDLITDEETGRVSGGLGVRYTEIVPLLVNAIKELTARVVALESQLSSAAA